MASVNGITRQGNPVRLNGNASTSKRPLGASEETNGKRKALKVGTGEPGLRQVDDLKRKRTMDSCANDYLTVMKGII